MNTAAGDADVERFRDLVVRRLGLSLDGIADASLRGVLRRRLTAYGGPGGTYLDRLEWDGPGDEIGCLAEELTVPETYFFRNIEQFRALAGVVLPERMRAGAAGRWLRLVSAGCASGEEAYTLAMVVREAVTDPAWDTSILGVDVNPAMLRRARAARYSPWALRATPAEARRRWFHAQGHTAVLDDEIRRLVRFVQRNLADDDPELWRPDTYDVVFCRNVLMYLTPDAARDVVGRVVRALAPGGFLFLGHAETVRGLSDELELRQSHDTFYYQRPEAARVPRAGRAPGAATPAGALTGAMRGAGGPVPAMDPAPPDADAQGVWAAAIGRSSERIQALTTMPARTATAVRHPPEGDDWNLALALLRAERFHEGLAVVEAFPPARLGRPDAQVLHGVLLAQCGYLDRAEAVCRRVLEADGRNAGAHYLLASCRENAGDRSGALGHHRAAAYLDPTFALPRLRLGLLARRGGDPAAARRDLDHALALLAREDERRLLLFGGGFTRQALMALCRAELVAAGGRP